MRTSRDGRWTLAVAILGSSLAFVDASVVNVALPSVQRDIGATLDHLQWVEVATTSALAAMRAMTLAWRRATCAAVREARRCLS